MPVVVHVGASSVFDARALASHAAQHGASAIAVMAPDFFRPTSLEDLINYCAAIAKVAPETPFYFYDIPSMTNVPVATARFLEEGSKRIPTLHGLKFTNNDLVTLQECLALSAFDVVFGFDEILLAGLVMGVRGAVGSTYNFAAPLYHRLFEGFARGDLETARRAQLQSVRLIRTLQSYGFSRASKAVIRLVGVDCGPVRLPLRPMSEDEVTTLAAQLHSFDGLAHASSGKLHVGQPKV
jgi:N-acetylneuraminate lyase